MSNNTTTDALARLISTTNGITNALSEKGITVTGLSGVAKGIEDMKQEWGEITGSITEQYDLQEALNGRVTTTGNRGVVAGYATPTVTAEAVTVNANSNDDIQVTGAVAITVENGEANTTWTKVISITNASATVALDTAWSWSGGEVPTISANSLVVLYWNNTVGMANFIEC